MPLETLIHPTSLFLTDLNLKSVEKEKPLFFDPERDISQADWQQLSTDFRDDVATVLKDSNSQKIDSVVSNAAFLKLLSPERFQEITKDIDLESLVTEAIKQTRNSSERYLFYTLIGRNAAFGKILFPSKRYLSASEWSGVKKIYACILIWL